MIFDFFFIFFYGGMLYFTCIYFSWLMPSWSKFANIMARVALVAAGLDIVENILMIVSWNREINSVITRITLVAAVLKFLLVIISIIAIGIMAVNRSFGMDKRKTL